MKAIAEEPWKCLTCGKRFDREVVCHYPPKGHKSPYPKLPSMANCPGKMVKE